MFVVYHMYYCAAIIELDLENRQTFSYRISSNLRQSCHRKAPKIGFKRNSRIWTHLSSSFIGALKNKYNSRSFCFGLLVSFSTKNAIYLNRENQRATKINNYYIIEGRVRFWKLISALQLQYRLFHHPLTKSSGASFVNCN